MSTSKDTAGQKMKAITILYGSQTGTAASYAKVVSNFARSRNFSVHMEAMDTFKGDLSQQKLVVFVCASYGNGEYPDNAIKFAKMLHEKQGQWLKDVRCAVFGLGQSKFPDFNKAAKDLSENLVRLGAKMVIEPAFGDEMADSGHEQAFRPWLKSLMSTIAAGEAKPKLLEDYALARATQAQPKRTPPPGFSAAKIKANKCLTPEGYERPTHVITLETDLKYNICDHCTVCVANPDTAVTRALKVLKLENKVYNITCLVDETNILPLPAQADLVTLFKYYLAITAVPSRALLDVLSTVATDVKQGEKLAQMAADMTQDNEYMARQRKSPFTIMDVLEEFSSVHMTLEQFVTYMPRLHPRVYSIASDPIEANRELDLVIVKDVCKMGDSSFFSGVGSTYLCESPVGETVYIQRMAGVVQFPEDPQVPLICVALGSGVAPIRAILRRRMRLHKEGKKPAKCLFYYAVRHQSKDFLFKDEWLQAADMGVCELQPVFSYDQAKFVTVADKIEEKPELVYKYLENKAVYVYCGIGGAVSELVEKAIVKAMTKVGNMTKYKASTSLADLRDTVPKRWFVESYAKDVDVENAIKSGVVRSKRDQASYQQEPLASHFQDADMFCFQCEQTYAGEGCYKMGVCGKTPELANLMDMLVHGTKVMSWYCHNARLVAAKHNETLEDDDANRFTFDALFSTLTNVNFDNQRFLEFNQYCRELVRAAKERYVKICGKHHETVRVCPVEYDSYLPPDDKMKTDIEGSVKQIYEKAGRVGILEKFKVMDDDALVGAQELIIYGLKGVAAYAGHASILGKESQKIFADMQRILATLLEPEGEVLSNCLDMALETGRINMEALDMLYKANAQFGVPSPTTVPVKPKPGKAILITGHDLCMLWDLLEQIRNTPGAQNVYVYTHGEMLPAHGYPQLRQHPNMGNHFGAAWQRQKLEFPHFPGPIVFTTNCLTPVRPEYQEQIFTLSVVGFEGCKHLKSVGEQAQFGPKSRHDFSEVIKMAMNAKGFSEQEKDFTYPVDHVAPRPEKLMVGFGHEAILGAAPQILDAINKGQIKRFVVIGGCDGYEGERNYFTELARNLPKEAVILTCGCGKYKINFLDYEACGDIPRLLDVGQCNDSYSCVLVALALADALKCEVKDLPLSIVLSWFEQKAVADFLMLLHLRLSPLRIGPALPAFLRPAVLKILVEQFGVKPVVPGQVKQDVELIMNAKGMAEGQR